MPDGHLASESSNPPSTPYRVQRRPNTALSTGARPLTAISGLPCSILSLKPVLSTDDGLPGKDDTGNFDHVVFDLDTKVEKAVDNNICFDTGSSDDETVVLK